MRELRWFSSDVLMPYRRAALLGALCVAPLAQAQEPPAKTQTDQPATPPGDQATPNAVRPINEVVVVTARRHDESMQDTPIAVSPFTGSWRRGWSSP